MMQHLVTALAFVAGFSLIFGINLLLLNISGDRKQQLRKRLEAELASQSREKARGSLVNKDLYEELAEGYGELADQGPLTDRVRRAIEQSGTSIQLRQLALLTAVSAAVPAALMRTFANWWISGLVALVCAAIPGLVIAVKRKRRREKLLSQLPDAFELMSRVLRAGQTVSQAMQSVGTEFPTPVSEEFAYCWEQQNLGLSPEAAMRDLARRTDLLELKIFVVAMMVHRSTGGNFSELLDKLARVIRDRYRIRGQIQALTAEGRFQAIILLALPPALMSVLFVINPVYVNRLFEYPALLVGMITFEIVGALWMRRIINFDF